MRSRLSGTNARVTAAALVLLLASLAVTDLIPVNSGAGYDGRHYARWTQTLSAEVLWADPGDRPPEIAITTYRVRRVLVPMTLHYTMRVLGVERSLPKVIATYRVANILLLTLSVLLWCLAADNLRIGDRGKWLGLIALLVSYVNWKMPLFYPTLTDSAAMAFGAGMLLSHLRGHQLALCALTLAGGFVWPSIPHFGLLLIAFPRERLDLIEPAPASLNRIAAAVAAGLGMAYVGYLISSGFDVVNSPVDPIRWLLPASGAVVGVYLYLGLAPLLDSRSLWQDVMPWRVLRRGWFWAAIAVLAAGELIVRSIELDPHVMDTARAVADTFMTSVHQPGVFFVAHVLHYGPLVLLLLFFWKPISGNIRRQGTGLTLCFALAVLLGVGSESRKLINFYPVIVLLLVQVAEPILGSWRRIAGVATLSLLFSKIWLPMAAPLDVPLVGELAWRTLYVSSRGPWIDATWWAVQGVVVLAAGALLYAYSRPGPSLPASSSAEDAASPRFLDAW